jgi:hypothetical protein
MSDRPRGPDDLKALAAQMDVPVKKLLVLSGTNDPFYAGGMPFQRERAEWFARLWRQFNFPVGVHIRRIHYVWVSQKPRLLLPDGSEYLNTDPIAKAMYQTSRWARHLGLVDAAAFSDHRNPDPHINVEQSGLSDDPSWSFAEFSPWELPKIETRLEVCGLELPDIEVKGYDYCPSDQPYLLEVWIEKSTMDDVLQPLCERLGVNLVTGVGFQSISGVVALLKRMATLPAGKPTRVWYASDFDPAGTFMPVAVARQVEFYRERFAPHADIKITPLVLTKDQVIEWELPRIPIKEEDLRKAGFEDRYGEGAVELDALEALHPGLLARIFENAITPYLDKTLEGQLEEVEDEALTDATEAYEEATQEERERLEEITEKANEITERYREEVEQINGRLQEELAPLKEQLEDVRREAQQKMDDLQITLPERPEPEIDEQDEDDWLYDSDRDYVDQLGHYHQHLGEETLEEMARTCERCGVIFMAKGTQKRYCSNKCSNAAWKVEDRRKNRVVGKRECPRCGKWFTTSRKSSRFCSDECRIWWGNNEARKRRAEAERNGQQKAKGRRKG